VYSVMETYVNSAYTTRYKCCSGWTHLHGDDGCTHSTPPNLLPRKIPDADFGFSRKTGQVKVRGPDLENIFRFVVSLSGLIVRSTYDGDLQRAELSLRNIV